MDYQQHIDELEATGYSIVPGVLGHSFCDEVLARIKGMEAEGVPPVPKSEYSGFNTVRHIDLLQHGEVWRRVAAHPNVLPIIRGVLGRDALLSIMATMLIDPGEKAQSIHRDDTLYRMAMPHRNLVCNTMWALCDFTEENGATRIVPNTHRLEKSPDRGAQYDSIAAVMPKGGLCFVLGTTYHGAGANRSDHRRWALSVNYCAGAMRQQYNFLFATPRPLIQTFSPELQALLGYRLTV